MKVYIAADHAGFELKRALMARAEEIGIEIEDCGAFTLDPADDYPDFVGVAAERLSKDAAAGIESRAIVIGASGQGEAMVANKYRGVRCALYYGPAAHAQTDIQGAELDMLASTRVHNDANALSLGARFLSIEEAVDAVRKWLTQSFSGEARHVRRIEKLDRLGA